jgi:hypothetical protein
MSRRWMKNLRTYLFGTRPDPFAAKGLDKPVAWAGTKVPPGDSPQKKKKKQNFVFNAADLRATVDAVGNK